MSKHTPAPWKSQAMSRNGYLESARVIFDAAGNEICRIDYEAMPTGSEGIKKSDENGALLAAAPELLDALKDIIGYAAAEIGIPPNEAVGGAFKKARAAIAKAEGK